MYLSLLSLAQLSSLLTTKIYPIPTYQRNSSQYTTIEYTLGRQAQVPPIFLFVVDTCLHNNDLKALRDASFISLSLIPPFALVGFITYGTMVRSQQGFLSLFFIHSQFFIFQAQVHEIGYSECNKSYVFRGSKEYTPKLIQDMLGLSSQARAAPRPSQPMPQQTSGAGRFCFSWFPCSPSRYTWRALYDRSPVFNESSG
jgi:protein transport protein SEC23